MASMKSLILNFNNAVHEVAHKDNFTVIGLLALSAASLFTTFMGMWAYTNFIIAFLLALGIQLSMLYAAIRYSTLPDKGDVKGNSLLVLFFSAMAVSSFFSFASFHELIEPPERRAEEADVLLRSSWAKLYNNLKSQAVGEFTNRVNGVRADGSRPLDDWNRNVSDLQARAATYQREAKSIVLSREAELMREPKFQQYLDSSERREMTRRETQKLQLKIAELERSTNEKEKEAEAAEARFNQEMKGGGTLKADGSVTKSGDGPTAKLYKADAARLKLEAKNSAGELEIAKGQLATVIGQTAAIDKTLRAIGNENELLRQKDQIELAKVQISQFGDKLSKLNSTPVQASAFTADGIKHLTTTLSDQASACSNIIALFPPTHRAVSDVDPGHPVAAKYEIANNPCAQQPRLADGSSISTHVQDMEYFIGNCAPENIADLEKNGKDTQNASQVPDKIGLLGGGKNAGSAAYAKIFDNLKKQFYGCLSRAPKNNSAQANQDTIDDFYHLLQTYNPQAHPFTRAMAAFERGDKTAEFAAMVAALIDLLIFITGIAMQSPASMSLADALDAAVEGKKEHEKIIDNFITAHRADELKIVYDQLSALTPEIRDPDGIPDHYYVFKMNQDNLLVVRDLLEEMHNLNLLVIEGDDVFFPKKTADEISNKLRLV